VASHFGSKSVLLHECDLFFCFILYIYIYCNAVFFHFCFRKSNVMYVTCSIKGVKFLD